METSTKQVLCNVFTKEWADVFYAELKRTALTISIWAVLAAALSSYNSWLLQDPSETGGSGHPDFAFPMLYTLCQMLLQFVVISVIFYFISDFAPTPSLEQFGRHWRQLFILSLVRLFQIGGENWALTRTSLSLNEAFKMFVPMMTMILACFLEKRRYGWPIVMAVTFLSTGAAMVAVAALGSHHTHSTMAGILLTIAATMAAAVSPVIAALLLNFEENSVLVVTWYEALFSLPAYFLMWIFTEGSRTFEFFKFRPKEAVGYLCTGALLALAYSLIMFHVIRITSSLTNVVLGSTRHVATVLIAATLIDKLTGVWVIVGLSLFAPAVILYAFLSLSNLVSANLHCGKAGAAADEEAQASGSAPFPGSSQPNESTALKANAG